jgi:hypothetical protein
MEESARGEEKLTIGSLIIGVKQSSISHPKETSGGRRIFVMTKNAPCSQYLTNDAGQLRNNPVGFF